MTNTGESMYVFGFLTNSTAVLSLPESSKERDEFAQIMSEFIEKGKLAEGHCYPMLTDGKFQINADEGNFSTDDVSFTIAKLMMHNNRKAGYWIAAFGLVYEISNLIEQHSSLAKILAENSGTDISEDYQIIHSLNADIRARLSMRCIGRLIDLLEDETLKQLKKILYACTSIGNNIYRTIHDTNIGEYRVCIEDTQNQMVTLFHHLCTHLNQNEHRILTDIRKQFQLLVDTVTSLINENGCLDDFLHILYRYSGLCNLIKYTLKELLTSANKEHHFENNLVFLRQTIEKTTEELTITAKHLMRTHHITIIGGGLCGVVLAIYLKTKFSLDVHVYDKLDDPRIQYIEHSSVSYTMSVSYRGFLALAEIGLEDLVRQICIPVYGRCFHTDEDQRADQLYGPRNEAIYVGNRDELLCLLISEAEKEGIHLYYGVECDQITYSDGATIIHAVEKISKRSIEIRTDYLLGTDGTNSKVRESIDQQLPSDQRSKIIKHKRIYREFRLPANRAGDYILRNDRIHMWPHDDFYMLAFPNTDGSFTLTLCVPSDYQNIEELQNDPSFMCSFMKEHFPDVSPFVQGLILTEPSRRWGSFNQVSAHRWHLSNKVLLLGDAAHAQYPFIGQGANCAFGDCQILARLIEATPGDWNTIFSQFQHRKRDTDAVINLAMMHEKNLSTRVISQEFRFRTKVSLEITRQDPQIQSQYSNITFTDIPYERVPNMSQTHEQIHLEVTGHLQLDYEDTDDQMIASTVANILSENRTLAKGSSSDEAPSTKTDLKQ